ncbi:MAG: permease-like cell division protein FtsX [Gaiellaceae bacterium]
MRVFFCNTYICDRKASRTQMDELRARLRNRDDVYSVRFVSSRQAFDTMTQRFPDEMHSMPPEFLPASLRVLPVKGAEPREIAASVPRKRFAVHAVKPPKPARCSG